MGFAPLAVMGTLSKFYQSESNATRPQAIGYRGSFGQAKRSSMKLNRWTETSTTKWITWECPTCEEEHEDPELLLTHCRKCGLIVIAVEGIATSEENHVPVINEGIA